MSAATAEVETVPAEIAHLDFDGSIRCEEKDQQGHECATVAAWWRVCLHCGIRTAMCHQHAMRLQRIASDPRSHVIVGCTVTRLFVPGPMWRQVFAFVPINTSSCGKE